MNYAFYIYAPKYTPFSSGIRVLYLLCDTLNKIGYESYVTALYEGSEFNAPNLTPEIINKHNGLGVRQVAIYPEIIMGNPLQSKYVIRWLLNRPNNFLQNWLGDFPDDEFIVHHDEVFKPKWIKSNKQYIPHIDRSIFNTQQTAVARKGVIIYQNRNKIDKRYRKLFKDIHYISIKNPMTPLECSRLYKKSSALIVAERTGAFGEAALCGCPTVFIDNNKFDSSYILDTYWKISKFNEYTSDINDLNQGNGEVLESYYDEEVEAEKNNLNKLINSALIFFDDIIGKIPDDISSILLENCNNLITSKNYKDAMILLERIFNLPKIPNKAYLYYYNICKDLNDKNGMEFAKNYLYNKIKAYEDNKIFEKIIDFNDNGKILI